MITLYNIQKPVNADTIILCTNVSIPGQIYCRCSDIITPSKEVYITKFPRRSRLREFKTINSLSLFRLGDFVIYTSFEGVIMSLHLHYIWPGIDMFVHNIMVYELTCLCMLSNVIIVWTSSFEFDSKLLLSMGYSRTASLLHLCFN